MYKGQLEIWQAHLEMAVSGGHDNLSWTFYAQQEIGSSLQDRRKSLTWEFTWKVQAQLLIGSRGHDRLSGTWKSQLDIIGLARHRINWTCLLCWMWKSRLETGSTGHDKVSWTYQAHLDLIGSSGQDRFSWTCQAQLDMTFSAGDRLSLILSKVDMTS